MEKSGPGRKPPISTTLNDDEELLKITEAQKILKCSTAQCYRMANSGMIPTTRIGGMLRIPRKELMLFIARHTVIA